MSSPAESRPRQTKPPQPESILRLVPPDRPDDVLSTTELGSRIVGLASRIAAATSRWLLLVAEFDRRDGCADWGMATTAAWLMHTCALSRRTAFEHVRVARSLSDHPKLAAEMDVGRLSYSQVRAITRVVGPDDATTVADLVQAAQSCSIGQLETVVRGLRVCERNDSDGPPEESDYVTSGWTSGSKWRLNAHLAPEAGALVESVLATIARTEELTRPQALVRIAELALTALNDSEHPPRPLRGDENVAVVVHVNAADIPVASTTERARPVKPETSGKRARPVKSETSAGRSRPAGRLAGGPGLRWPIIESLLCKGRIRTAVLDGDGNIQHLGRSYRVVPLRLFKALLHRDGGHCTHPGCNSRASLQAHHVVHWLAGGRTELANLVLLCEAHHHRHHEGEFTIQAVGVNTFRFLRKDGLDLAIPTDRDVLAETAVDIDIAYSTTETDAATPKWDGTRMDRAFAISCLADRRERDRQSRGGRSREPQQSTATEDDVWAK